MKFGKLTMVTGPMFASKSTEILKRVLWARHGESLNVLVVKPGFDDRYSTTKIVSHDGLSVEAESIHRWEDIHNPNPPDLVCVDEIQFFQRPFFDGDIVEIVRGFLENGVDVVCAGLDMDANGKPFPVSASLIAMADEVIKKTAHCSICGSPAPKTKKLTEGTSTVELGEKDKYEPRCNKHWRG